MLNVPKLLRFLLTISAATLAFTGMAPVAQAQGADEEMEESITTGTRRAERTAAGDADQAHDRTPGKP